MRVVDNCRTVVLLTHAVGLVVLDDDDLLGIVLLVEAVGKVISLLNLGLFVLGISGDSDSIFILMVAGAVKGSNVSIRTNCFWFNGGYRYQMLTE